MKKALLTSLVVAALVCAFALPNLSAATKAPADMVLKAPEGMKMKKTPVAFPHGKHEALLKDCKVCHHTYEGSGDVKGCSSAGCHDQASKKEKMSFYKAFHDKKSKVSCLGCHKAEKKGPKSCKDCHPKK
ncbi:cytochrome c3 family protein [Pseudodesulfovibrio senegalensis]|jgi:hypothetical protein|uniref:Cytochrome c3 family protein n=1 Tax=Pseudodesulfovibrio senegalensis TaxID=1721087 RepID=A0A6N6N3K0_9BACT|nr:cytochrome c3 family protein [Pseudodesulfovibrio senegalensis]KAB1442762.1 cytochrome c3 family protein [Pseudodesulfovibrio senegalensis]